MALAAVPIVCVLMFAVWRLRQSGRLTIRLAGLMIGLTALVSVGIEGTPSDTFRGESFVAGAVVGLVVATCVIGYLVVWRRFGGTISGVRMKW